MIDASAHPSLANYFLLLSLVFAAQTLIATQRSGEIKMLLIPYFFIAWLTSELAWFHLLIQAICALSFICLGVLLHGSGWLALLITIASCYGLYRLHLESHWANHVFLQSLRRDLGHNYLDSIDPQRRSNLRNEVPRQSWLHPFRMRLPKSEVKLTRNMAYGDHLRNRLDIYHSVHKSDQPKPVLLQIHGGGWIIGDKQQQGLPLMNHLAARGWVCVAINYRLSPGSSFPDHLIDVKRALTWIKREIAYYGGDANFIIATGGSAGGHLSSLLALSANKHQAILQPGFEELDTSINGCVPFYGVYDFLDRNNTKDSPATIDFLAKYVMQCRPEDKPELWDLASPITFVDDQAPPMMIIHGTHDSIAKVEEAQVFAQQLRDKSKQPVVYAELPRTQHAFEIFHSVRTEYAINAVSHFVEYCYAQYLQSKNSN